MCQLYYIYKIVNCLMHIHVLGKTSGDERAAHQRRPPADFPAGVCIFPPVIAKEHA